MIAIIALSVSTAYATHKTCRMIWDLAQRVDRLGKERAKCRVTN